ncbi:ribosomal protein L7/L12 [Actinoplanes sp. NPDC051861]|uniref:ribosomal protein L7/L12 n=1 Tax=Actinoplanes sp. NPDC051861 TaxID=3155170 RepID=UPI003413CFD1
MSAAIGVVTNEITEEFTWSLAGAFVVLLLGAIAASVWNGIASQGANRPESPQPARPGPQRGSPTDARDFPAAVDEHDIELISEAPPPVPRLSNPAPRAGLFDVVLTSIAQNDRKTAVGVVRDVTGLGGMEAFQITKRLPTTLARGLDGDTADKMVDLLHGLSLEAHELPSSLDADERHLADDGRLYDVVLHQADRKKITSLQLVAKAGRLDAAAATDVLNNLPQIIQLNVDRSTAERTIMEFLSVGAEVQLVLARTWAEARIIRPAQPR